MLIETLKVTAGGKYSYHYALKGSKCEVVRICIKKILCINRNYFSHMKLTYILIHHNISFTCCIIWALCSLCM
jgi:hypothetical protein